jgi:hypothetical protein
VEVFNMLNLLKVSKMLEETDVRLPTPDSILTTED